LIVRDPDIEDDDALKVLTAGPDAAGRRLDQWLAGELGPELSRSRIKGLIEAGAVTLNNLPAPEAKLKLKDGDVIALTLPEAEPAEPEPEDIALDILFEDKDVIVINKPAGLVVHPGNGNWTGTLVNALIHHCADTLSGIGGVKRPGIVHRLDKDTTGVMVVAKNDQAHRSLAEAFADHGRTGGLERAYLALVWGAPERVSGTIDAPLGRSQKDRTRQAVVKESQSDARHAVTHFEVLERFGIQKDGDAFASLIECRLETGRTHQIRVHMAHIGHPLIGDAEYGAAFKTKSNRLPEPLRTDAHSFARQALHAGLLAFEHPRTGKITHFEAELPQDMQRLVAGFRALDLIH
jgi:23S rRNA pseudouridine1911/1915/1917 synthase